MFNQIFLYFRLLKPNSQNISFNFGGFVNGAYFMIFMISYYLIGSMFVNLTVGKFKAE
jgi:hypothetical protein